MSLASLLNQTVTLYSKSSYSQDGREVVGSGTNYKARVQVKRLTRRAPNNEVIVIDAIVYLLSSVTIEINDRVDYSGVSYKVAGKYVGVDGAGSDHHIKIELTKWQTT